MDGRVNEDTVAGRPLAWDEAPDVMDLAFIVTAASIYKCWRVPAGLGLTAVLCSSLCWEERSLGRRQMAVSAGRASIFWTFLGLGVGIYYFATSGKS